MQFNNQILGRCQLDSILGVGNTSVVYLGHHQTLGVPMAVKVVKEALRSPNDTELKLVTENFRREASIVARLNHEGIVRVLDFGEETGHPYLVMEYVNGKTLFEYMRTEAPLPERLAMKIMIYLSSALAAVHALDIVHRNLKPSKIFMTKSGQFKLSGFNLASGKGQLFSSTSSTSKALPTYMAPECFHADKPIGPEADIYSLGVILYELIYGVPPFTGTLNQVITGQLYGVPEFENGKLSADTVAFLKFFIGGMLNKNPKERILTCADIKQICKARIDELNAKYAVPGNTTSANELITKNEPSPFHKIADVLESGLGAKVTEYQGQPVTHTTLRERLLIWGLLIVLLGSCLIAYFY